MTLTTANDTPATLMIIDDHPLLRRGVAQLLELEDDLELVGETGDLDSGCVWVEQVLLGHDQGREGSDTAFQEHLVVGAP